MNKKQPTKNAAKVAAKAKTGKYVCSSCGLIVNVDEERGCVGTGGLVCCGKTMLPKK